MDRCGGVTDFGSGRPEAVRAEWTRRSSKLRQRVSKWTLLFEIKLSRYSAVAIRNASLFAESELSLRAVKRLIGAHTNYGAS